MKKLLLSLLTLAIFAFSFTSCPKAAATRIEGEINITAGDAVTKETEGNVIKAILVGKTFNFDLEADKAINDGITDQEKVRWAVYGKDGKTFGTDTDPSILAFVALLSGNVKTKKAIKNGDTDAELYADFGSVLTQNLTPSLNGSYDVYSCKDNLKADDPLANFDKVGSIKVTINAGAKVADATISETKDTPIADGTELTINVYGTEFKAMSKQNSGADVDYSNIIKNLPKGLKLTLSADVTVNAENAEPVKSVTFVVSGTPTATSAKATLQIDTSKLNVYTKANVNAIANDGANITIN